LVFFLKNKFLENQFLYCNKLDNFEKMFNEKTKILKNEEKKNEKKKKVL
jgi:hypothetical protein